MTPSSPSSSKAARGRTKGAKGPRAEFKFKMRGSASYLNACIFQDLEICRRRCCGAARIGTPGAYGARERMLHVRNLTNS
ncbi:hypothetical protein Naga_101527g1 [Nannochloropsis gaditana]|uniref:Uncharacterized protein n=1 Tax=Nannochloropsis gaditana TaxID=72520 RepID=W7TLU3_9STRA|nr:hypothetical protein Naga_101527g1 [Nannochloropsis gaditana]